jgi:hypothetical protein
VQEAVTTADALVDPTGRYRYWLTRHWDDLRRPVTWVMLNPSTADASQDDATIRSCTRLSRPLGGGLVVVNLFAWRATEPAGLKTAADPVGPDNDEHLLIRAFQGKRVIAAWGTPGTLLGRGEQVTRLLRRAGIELWCYGVTKNEQPRHPLYLPTASELVPYAGGL